MINNLSAVAPLAAEARAVTSSVVPSLLQGSVPALKSDVLSLNTTKTPRKGLLNRLLPMFGLSDRNAVKIKKGVDDFGRPFEAEFTGKVKTRETFFNSKGKPTTTHLYHNETGRKIGKIEHDNKAGYMVVYSYNPETGQEIGKVLHPIRKPLKKATAGSFTR